MANTISHVADLLERPGMPSIALTIAAPDLEDCPLVYANKEFAEMTGYRVEEIEGLNCRFLQGPDTEASAVAEIRENIAFNAGGDTCILNYRKDGSTFFNFLSLRRLRSPDGEDLLMGCQFAIPDDVGRFQVMTQLKEVERMNHGLSPMALETVDLSRYSLQVRADSAFLKIDCFLKQQRIRGLMMNRQR